MKRAVGVLVVFTALLAFAGPLAAKEKSLLASAPQSAQCLRLAGLSLHAPGSGANRNCCKRWEKSTCAEKDGNGKCIRWNYKCVEWGKPPCRTR